MGTDRKWLFLALAALVVALAGAEAFYLTRGTGGGGTIQGIAAVPTSQAVQVGGVIQVQNRVVHLVGLVPPREEPNCTINRGLVVHCTLITAAKLAELVAGKTVRCRIQRFGRDDRNWGVCSAVGAGAPSGDRPEDTINGQLLLSGWALPKEEHGREWVQLGLRARNAGAGLWPGNVVPDPMRTGTLYGVLEINDGNTLEIREVRMRLYGIDAPDLAQECTLNGISYQCGLLAYVQLIDITAGKGRVTCYASKLEGDDRAYGKCGLPTPSGADIRADAPTFNEMMVRSGWAIADRRFTNDYVAAEEEAKREKRGMWAGEFVMPSEWRNGKR
jgi:endonuclease YncB( thermonuclease family)